MVQYDRIGRQNDLISNAHRTVSETEEVGMEITAELARNREKIESSRAKVGVFSEAIRVDIDTRRVGICVLMLPLPHNDTPSRLRSTLVSLTLRGDSLDPSTAERRARSSLPYSY